MGKAGWEMQSECQSQKVIILQPSVRNPQWMLNRTFGKHQDICMVLQCLLTACLLVTTENKNHQLYRRDTGERLAWEIKIIISERRWISYATRYDALSRRQHHLCRIPVENANLISSMGNVHTNSKFYSKGRGRTVFFQNNQCQKAKVWKCSTLKEIKEP